MPTDSLTGGNVGSRFTNPPYTPNPPHKQAFRHLKIPRKTPACITPIIIISGIPAHKDSGESANPFKNMSKSDSQLCSIYKNLNKLQWVEACLNAF